MMVEYTKPMRLPLFTLTKGQSSSLIHHTTTTSAMQNSQTSSMYGCALYCATYTLNLFSGILVPIQEEMIAAPRFENPRERFENARDRFGKLLGKTLKLDTRTLFTRVSILHILRL